MLAYGAELHGRGVVVTAGFETRRLLRSAAIIGGLAVVVVVASQSGFLFPQPERHQVTPPQLPKFPPPGPDQVLFRVHTPRPLPFRLGTIDVYEAASANWLLPPYDSNRYQPVTAPAVLPGVARAGTSPAGTVTFQIGELGGHELPTVPEATRISGLQASLKYDPRSGISTCLPPAPARV